jgi:hypothetical protein
MCAYFYQHFLHVTSTDGLNTVVRNNFESVILPEGSSTTLSSTYSEAAIQAKLAKGMAYYNSNPSKFTDAEFDRCGMRTLTAQPTAQALTVDGQTVNGAEIYAVNGNNYFKLRDVAQLLTGTDVQFSVDYDSAKDAIVITTGAGYTSVGGELASSGEDKSSTIQPTSQSLILNGKTINMSTIAAYAIGGNNYFKLRDLGTLLGFTVDYDETTNTIVVTSVAPATTTGNGQGGQNGGQQGGQNGGQNGGR